MRRLLFALGVLLALSAATAQAQAEKRIIFDAYGAFVMPTGDYGEGFKGSPGFGAALGYYVTPAIMITGNFNWGFMKGKIGLGGTTVDQDVMNFFATLGYDFLAAERNMALAGFLGGGVQMFKSKIAGGALDGDSKSYPTVNAGFTFNYWFTSLIGLVLQTGVTYAITKEADFGMNSAITLPQAAGVSLKF